MTRSASGNLLVDAKGRGSFAAILGSCTGLRIAMFKTTVLKTKVIISKSNQGKSKNLSPLKMYSCSFFSTQIGLGGAFTLE